MTQLAMFVDGWNFYWSLVDADIKPYGWCNFPLLARQQTGFSDAAVTVKYFTSADKPHPEKISDRQMTIWWQALRFIGCQVIQGEFRATTTEVEEQIKVSRKTWREKQTDIALASHMIADCSRIEPDPERSGRYLWKPGYDQAILLTQDSDFVPLVKLVAAEQFKRPVLVLLPPSTSVAQENALRIWRRLDGSNVVVKQLSQTDLADALLPKVVEAPKGARVTCYRTWMWREKHEGMFGKLTS